MTLQDITTQFNTIAKIMEFPLLAITDCKTIDKDYDMEEGAEYEYCCFPHYYQSKSGKTYSLVFDDYGSHGYWELYDEETSDLIVCEAHPQKVLEHIEQ